MVIPTTWLTFSLMLLNLEGFLCASHQIYAHGIDVTTQRPLIIAHRGASGIYPEHSEMAYKRGKLDGADMIECDVVVSSDGVFICRHDPWLSTSTNILDHPEFAGRKRTIVDFEYYGTFKNITDWFVADFTLDELKTLRVNQVNSERDPGFDGMFPMVTLEEFIKIAKDSDIGISVELKYPRWTNSLGIFETSFEQAFIEVLQKHGYKSKTDPCIVQSFEFESLKVLSKLTDLPLMMAIEYEHQATPELLSKYADVSYGVITWKCSVAEHYANGGYKNWIKNVTDVVQRIHDRKMKAHLYTFRNEQSNLAWNYNQDPRNEYDLFMELNVDGYYADFPATLASYLDEKYKSCDPVNSSSSLASAWSIVWIALFAGIM